MIRHSFIFSVILNLVTAAFAAEVPSTLPPVGESFTIGAYYAMPSLEPKDNFDQSFAFMDMARIGCNFVVVGGNCFADSWAAIKRWDMEGVTQYHQIIPYPGQGKWKSSDHTAGILLEKQRLDELYWNGEYVGDAVVGHIMQDEPECHGMTEDQKNYLRTWADAYHKANPGRMVWVNHCDPPWYDMNQKVASCSAAPTIAVNSQRIAERQRAAKSIGLDNFVFVALLGRLYDWSGASQGKTEQIEYWGMGPCSQEVYDWLKLRSNERDAYEQLITAYAFGNSGFHPYLYNQHRGYSFVDKDGNDPYGIRSGFSAAAHDLRRSQGWPGVELFHDGKPFKDRETYPAGEFILTADAISDSGTISKVIFGKSINGGGDWESVEDSDAPYTVTFSANAGETVIFRARALDADGHQSIYAANMIYIGATPAEENNTADSAKSNEAKADAPRHPLFHDAIENNGREQTPANKKAGETIPSNSAASISPDYAIRAVDCQITPIQGHYASVDSDEGQVIVLATDSSGNPSHAIGEIKFNFPDAIPNGRYILTVHWETGAMGATPWAYRLGSDGGRVVENGVKSNSQWHYFYPGLSGSHDDQSFSHDLAGPNPIDFAVWPNSPVGASVALSGIKSGGFYVVVRDLSPARNNYFRIKAFNLTKVR